MTQTMQQILVLDNSPSTLVLNSTTSSARMPSPELASSSTSISHTQVQIDSLYEDMARLEATHHQNANLTILNMRRQMSDCENEVRLLVYVGMFNKLRGTSGVIHHPMLMTTKNTNPSSTN